MVVPAFVIHGRLEVVVSHISGKIANVIQSHGVVPDPKIKKTFIVTKPWFGWLDS